MDQNKKKKKNPHLKYDVYPATIIRPNRGARLAARHSAGITGSKMTHSTMSVIMQRAASHPVCTKQQDGDTLSSEDSGEDACIWIGHTNVFC